MKKLITVTNIITGKVIKNTFTDRDVGRLTLEEWVSYNVSRSQSGQGWGWAARDVRKEDLADNLLPLVLSEFDVTEPITGEVVTYCKLKAEYEYTIEDLTTEDDVEQAEIADDAVTLEQIKAAVSIIDGWTQLSDINITFLKKFFKYLIKKSI